jgi:hypothetical protein
VAALLSRPGVKGQQWGLEAGTGAVAAAFDGADIRGADMTQADFDRDTIDWGAPPTEPVVHWQGRQPSVPPAELAVGVATLLVFTLGAFALGLLVSERLGSRSPLKRWF